MNCFANAIGSRFLTKYHFRDYANLCSLRNRHIGLLTTYSSIRCKMTEKNNDNHDHLLITANQAREDVTARAIVTDVRQETPTVRGISLRIENDDFSFKAGQWVDVFIPGVKEVGGFSISSSPIKLVKTKKLDLAVKISQRAPAQWFYKQCQIGSRVDVRVGGDFHFNPAANSHSDNILLIAGGVGINPLASILQYCADLRRNDDTNAPEKVLLLFSARNADELLLNETFFSISKEIPTIQCKFFVTRQSMTKRNIPIESTRINKDHVQQAITSLGKDTVTTYLCGPLAMINDMRLILEELNISKEKIKFEKWW